MQRYFEYSEHYSLSGSGLPFGARLRSKHSYISERLGRLSQPLGYLMIVIPVIDL